MTHPSPWSHCLLRYIVIIVNLSLCAGCATKHFVSVSSWPQGATVQIDGEAKGTTPTRLKIEGDGEFILSIEKEGYASQQVMLETKRSWRSLFLTLGGGAVGISLSYLIFQSRMENAGQTAIAAYATFCAASMGAFILSDNAVEPSGVHVTLEATEAEDSTLD